jgi:hypothetical protein
MTDGFTGGYALDGGGGSNSLTYADTATPTDLTVNLVDETTITVSDGQTSDTLTQINNVTTANGDDTFNLDVNVASNQTAYAFNGGSGSNVFNLIFDGSQPLSAAVSMTLTAETTAATCSI